MGNLVENTWLISDSFLVLRPLYPPSIKMELVLPTLSVSSDQAKRNTAGASPRGLFIFKQLVKHMAGIMVTTLQPRCTSFASLGEEITTEASGCAAFYKSRHGKLFHSRKKRQRQHVGHINMLTERKSWCYGLKQHIPFLTSISCWCPYQTTIS